MKECMFCNRDHNHLFGGKIKYCEFCKREMEDVEVKAMINKRKEELKMIKD